MTRRLKEASAVKAHDAPLERFLTAVRSGNVKAAQRELREFPDLAQVSIHAASGIGDADAVRYHLDLDPKLINAEHGGWPPLIYARASCFLQVNPWHAAGILDCVSLLLDRGADPVQARTMPTTPLDDALIEISRADPMFMDEIRKRLAPVKDRFFEKSSDADKTREPSALPLFLTEPDLKQVAIEMAKFAIERGINVNLAVAHDGSTMLHEFARLKDYPAIAAEAVEWLLLHGADPNLPRDDGQTPFLLAVRTGCTAAAEVMRAHGADAKSVRPLDELMGACRNRDANAAREILQSHPDVLTAMGPEACEPLVSAAAANRQNDVRFMAQLGFDLGGIGENGASALHVASWNGQVEMVRLLLELEAPVNVRDATFGTSPLAWAAQGSKNSDAQDDYCRIVEALLDAGTDFATCVNRWGVGPEQISSAPVAALLRARGFSSLPRAESQ
jgi:ankyrin repeat protein